MAIRWNDIKAQRAARDRSLGATPEPIVEPTLLNESISSIEVNGITTDPSWRIFGVSPIAADPISGEVPPPEAIERFPSRSRDLFSSKFTQRYENLDSGLDQSIINSFGLTLEYGSTSTWTTYFPTMESDTQVYTNPYNKPAYTDGGLIVGSSTVFNTTALMDGTSYVVGTAVYGREGNLQGGPSWSGIITLREDANSMEVAITSVTSPESINMDSSSQHWYISNDANLLDNLF